MTGEPLGDETPVTVRRVAMQVTGYLRHGLLVGGFYDMQTGSDGGNQYSIPQGAVDEASIRDAPPERLLADWRRFADALDVERGAL